MRLGMTGCFLPADMNDIDSAMCRRVRAAGFGGIFTRFHGYDPLDEEDLANAYLGAIVAVAMPGPGRRFEAVFVVGDEAGEEHDLSKADRLIGWQPRLHRLLAA